jgi:hypothetical protein
MLGAAAKSTVLKMSFALEQQNGPPERPKQLEVGA